MNVLSLFNGMSCGAMALDRAGIQYDNYFSSEIDKHAIKVTQANYPKTIQIGDVRDVNSADLPPIDLILCGSPCQGFSNAGKGLNFNDPRSALFFEFIRIWKECKAINPNVKFLLENVRMKKEWEDTISRLVGMAPVYINAALVSAQNRDRCFWTDIYTERSGLFDDVRCAIPQPKDMGILLKDILQPAHEVDEKYYISEKALARILRKEYSEPRINPDKSGTINTKNNSGQLSVDSGTTLIAGVVNNNGEISEIPFGKANCIDANYFKGADNHGQRTMVREPIQLNPSTESGGVQPYQQNRIYDTDGIAPAFSAELGGRMNIVMPAESRADRVYGVEGKSVTQVSSTGGLGSSGGLYQTHSHRIRRLTEIEVECLFGVSDNYTNHVSSTQRYKMLGNGWNVDVITHILKYCKK